MQVEAIYHQGRLIFTQPIRLQQHTFKVKVEVPDAELLPDALPSPAPPSSIRTSSLRERIDAILAPYQSQLKHKRTFTPKDYKAMWHEHLWEQYIGRH